MSSVTSVVLTNHEEKNLPYCLSSLQWSQRTVVVDSGSTDQTLSIARDFGADIFENKPDNFSHAKQRNWALDNVEIDTDWVLFLDADEEVTNPLRDEILREINNAPDEVTGYQLAPKFMFMGRWLKNTMKYPSWHDRLVRYGRARFQGNVFEEFRTDGEIRQIREPYLHYGFRKGFKPWVTKHVGYAKDKAEEMFELSKENDLGFGKLMGELLSPSTISRTQAAELLGARTFILGPPMRFLHYYVVRMGFLDGAPGLLYSQLMAMYQLLLSFFYLEEKLQDRGESF